MDTQFTLTYYRRDSTTGVQDIEAVIGFENPTASEIATKINTWLTACGITSVTATHTPPA